MSCKDKCSSSQRQMIKGRRGGELTSFHLGHNDENHTLFFFSRQWNVLICPDWRRWKQTVWLLSAVAGIHSWCYRHLAKTLLCFTALIPRDVLGYAVLWHFTFWFPLIFFPHSFFLFFFLGLSSQPSGKGRRLPEVYCIVSRLGCFDLFSKVEKKNT